MARKLLKHSIFIGILILFDQITKLIVNANFTADEQFRNGLHIHPSLHTKFEDGEIVPQIVIGVILGILLSLIAWKGNEFFFHDCPERMKKSYPAFTNTMLYLLTSGTFCSVVLDALVWGGSLNFICIAWQALDSYRNSFIKHLIFDIKDIYLTVGIVLLFIRIFMIALKISKEDEKQIAKKLRHPIKSIREMKGVS